jgi:ATP-binding cassette subfamily F protein 3
MIKLQNLSIRRGTRLLFEDANLLIHPGQKIGLTGANGAGKSSLFALFRGLLHADNGEVDIPDAWTIAHVAQETPAVDMPALDYVLQGDAELMRLQAELVIAEKKT